MTPTNPAARWTRRAALGVIGSAVGLAAVACTPSTRSAASSSRAAAGGSTAPTTTEAPKPTVELSFLPAAGATGSSVLTPATVTSAKGTLTAVTLTNADGKAVVGALDATGTTWTSGEVLGYGKTYTWAGTATGTDGLTAPLSGSFTTVTPKSTTRAVVNAAFADGATVGVATPIIVQFDDDIADKAAVEKLMVVTTTPVTEGSWAWLPDSGTGPRAHWRPKSYWATGTTVQVSVPVYGVALGGDTYGAGDASSAFTIGRNQVVKADVTSFHIVVERDGDQVARYPVSFGSADLDRNVTRTGIHVVTEKHEDYKMTNLAAGYKDVEEHWAVRISNNGEFIHANPETVGVQGIRNVSNGCVNMSTANATEYFKTAIYGDPVEVTNSRIPLSSADGDIYDWAIDWPTWQSMSALA